MDDNDVDNALLRSAVEMSAHRSCGYACTNRRREIARLKARGCVTRSRKAKHTHTTEDEVQKCLLEVVTSEMNSWRIRVNS